MNTASSRSSSVDYSSSTGSRPRVRPLLLLGGAAAAGVAAGAVARQVRRRTAENAGTDDDRLPLGWGDSVVRPPARTVSTPDGARLAVWDIEGAEPDAPVVVLPHCWGCSHEVWVPVARRLLEQDCRVVLYDQRGHGASSRGTAPLSIETLAHDFALVLETLDAHDVVLAGHSMGGITIMSLATHRPEVLNKRTRAIVLVSTTATSPGSGSGSGDRSARYLRSASALIGSPLVTRALQAPRGHLLVRGVFGREPVRSHLVLTRDLFAGCDGSVRGGFLSSMASMNLLEGISAMDVPTTVMVGSRDTLTAPVKSDEIVASVRGARLLTLSERGHMLPLEDPDAVTDEIVRAVKG